MRLKSSGSSDPAALFVPGIEFLSPTPMFPTFTSDTPTRMRQVAWMPILTQRGVYEKVNSITASGSNNFQMVSPSH